MLRRWIKKNSSSWGGITSHCHRLLSLSWVQIQLVQNKWLIEITSWHFLSWHEVLFYRVATHCRSKLFVMLLKLWLTCNICLVEKYDWSGQQQNAVMIVCTVQYAAVLGKYVEEQHENLRVWTSLAMHAIDTTAFITNYVPQEHWKALNELDPVSLFSVALL